MSDRLRTRVTRLRARCFDASRHVPGFARRHRAFLARLRSCGGLEARVGPVPRILRRARAAMRLYCFRLLPAAPRHLPGRSTERRVERTSLVHTAVTLREVRRNRHSMLVRRHTRELRRLLMTLQSHVIERRAVAAPRVAAATRARAERAAVVAPERWRDYPPVVRAFARPPAAAPAAGRAPGSANAAAARSESGNRSGPVASESPSVTLAPAELSRVTRHVIGELDRRVLSYRERMGLV